MRFCEFPRDFTRASTGINPVRGLAAQKSNETVAPATQDDTNHEVVSDRVEVAMEEDDTNPNQGVEEALPFSFFHASSSFPDDVNEASPDQQILAGDSMKKNVPGSNTQPGNSDKDDRQVNPSSDREVLPDLVLVTPL